MSEHLLTLNAGSSSLKFALFEIAASGPGPGGARPAMRLAVRGGIDGPGGQGLLQVRDRHGGDIVPPRELGQVTGAYSALEHALAALRAAVPGMRIGGVGHRVVHGCAQFSAPAAVDDNVLEQLAALTSLAPLHQPHNVACIRAARSAFPHAVQVACFDTAFHRTHDFVEDVYALPRSFYDQGIRRYGFHGISYQYIASRLPLVAPALAGGRTVVAHLGNGASLCALRAGRSVSSTMGFSPLDGLPMGTRCGSIDPGVVMWLLQNEGLDAAGLADLLYRESGLKGLSGVSADMRLLLASTTSGAREAVEFFVARVQREIGALAAVLQGLDGVVFTAGIGEHAAPIRQRILAGLGWLGVEPDQAANESYDGVGAACLTKAGSRVQAWVIPTDEEGMIAEHTAHFLPGSATTIAPSPIA
jgi:acetate kinase